MANNYHKPSFTEEKLLAAQGYRLIAGVDEVGRGALAGPVMASAVILPPKVSARWVDQVRDSKQLTPATRELLYRYIQKAAISIGIGKLSHEYIDAFGIARATRLAMKAAIEQLAPLPHYLLIDYLSLPDVMLPQRGIIHGDGLCFSIACASIVAKVTRDRLMVELDGIYPGYGLARHKGYATEEHITCLHRLGPCPIHRRSFRPLKDMVCRAR
ncbi:ribonuclease HII [Chloroflexota bacterium]